MKLSEKQIIFSKNIASLIIYADMIGINVTFGEAYRTKEQQYLYFYGYTLSLIKSVLTLLKGKRKSKTMNSLHLKRLAVDFNFFIDGRLTYDFEELKELGKFWCLLHPKNRWGGDFNKNGIEDGFLDTPHFEMQE